MQESITEIIRVCVGSFLVIYGYVMSIIERYLGNVIKLVEKHKDLNIRNNMGSFYFIKMLTRIKKCVVAFAIKC